MESLIIVVLLAGAVLLGIGIAFHILLWSTLKMHRRAMDALHRELAQRSLARRAPEPAPDHTDWNSQSAQRQRRPGQ
jgi:hypothetical protein